MTVRSRPLFPLWPIEVHVLKGDGGHGIGQGFGEWLLNMLNGLSRKDVIVMIREFVFERERNRLRACW